MKKYILSIIAMALYLQCAIAQTVRVDDVILNHGETKEISIYLSNTKADLVSFQMDLILPEGITLNKAACSLGDRIIDPNQELTIGKLTDGSFRITSTSFALTPISGTTGAIVELSLSADDDAKGGTASLRKILFATSSSQKLISTDVSFSVNVSYALTYKVDGEVYHTSTVVYGTPITPIPTPQKEGYTFSGWNELPATMPARDVTVTGSFSINQYRLTFILDGKEYKSYKIEYNTVLTPEPVPAKRGMTFSGWGDMPETMPSHDVTLYGWYNGVKETIDGIIYQVKDTLNNYASVIGTDKFLEKATILPDVLIDGDIYHVTSIADGCLPETMAIYTSVGRLLLCLWKRGYENIQETGSGRSLVAPEFSLVKSTASSLTISFVNEYPEFMDTIFVNTDCLQSIEKGGAGYKITLRGLEPGRPYVSVVAYSLTMDEEKFSKKYSYETLPITLTTQQPRVITAGNVIVAAKANLDEEETNVGFEWRRIDWPDDFVSNIGPAYLYDDQMEGYIRNLYTEKFWKYRPYYTSKSGRSYYGEWVGIDPINTNYYEPTVYTYATINVAGNRAEVKGYAMRGTDKVTSQGFMCWKNTSPYSLRKRTPSIPADAMTVAANGYMMTAVFEDLEYETTYCYVAFVKTEENEMFFGEVRTFCTNTDSDGIVGVTEDAAITEMSYYDVQGRRLSAPQRGINIIRMSDGMTRKVLIK